MSIKYIRWLRISGAILLLIGAAFVYGFVRMWLKLPESYVAWTSGNAVEGYMLEHTNQWPRSWEELRSATNRALWYVPVERLQESVRIDWKVDVAQLTQAAKRDPNLKVQVVTRLDGQPLESIWGWDTEPNSKILHYLRTVTNVTP